MSQLVIKNGVVFKEGRWTQEELFVREGYFTKKPATSGADILDVKGAWILPGLVDAHVHLRDGALSSKETYESGAAAATAGGVTSCLVMANGDPILDHAELVEQFHVRARHCSTRLYPVGAVTLGQRGQTLVDFVAMKNAGCVAFSDDGQTIMDASVLLKALQWSEMLNVPVILHEEDRCLSPQTGMNEGPVALQWGLPSSHEAAESALVARDLEIMLAKTPKAVVHIAHASSLRTVELVRQARERGLSVSTEVTPHHLYFDETKVGEVFGLAKMSPPLRGEATRLGLWKSFMDGHIDMCATDHAPHTLSEKSNAFSSCPCGVVGLETALSTLWTLSNDNQDFFGRAVRAMSEVPAKKFHLPGGIIREGAPADFVVFDPKEKWKVHGSELFTKAKHTPWENEILAGRVQETWIGGQKVFSR